LSAPPSPQPASIITQTGSKITQAGSIKPDFNTLTKALPPEISREKTRPFRLHPATSDRKPAIRDWEIIRFSG
jgi:hypothetical protein